MFINHNHCQGKKVNYDKVLFFCENEKWNSTKNVNATKIGF